MFATPYLIFCFHEMTFLAWNLCEVPPPVTSPFEILLRQSATASIMHIKVEKRFDPECGAVIGERTELK